MAVYHYSSSHERVRYKLRAYKVVSKNNFQEGQNSSCNRCFVSFQMSRRHCCKISRDGCVEMRSVRFLTIFCYVSAASVMTQLFLKIANRFSFKRNVTESTA